MPKQPLFERDLGLVVVESVWPCGILKSIGTIVRKLNISYKPLGVAVFLVIGGLLLGSLIITKTGVIKQKVSLGGSTFISEAQGAEIDSAALTVHDAPFLASANSAQNSSSAESLNVFYGDGAMKDPGSL